MANSTKICSNCHKDFLIIDQEEKFLNDKKLVLPAHCPQCRQERRLKLRVARALYDAVCQKCGKEIIITYNPKNAKTIILCKQDYDNYFQENDILIKEQQPLDEQNMTAEYFFRELQKLIDSTPKRPSLISHSENCDYGDKILFSKNLFVCFDCQNSENSTYVFVSYMIVSSIDCDYSVELQHCYECFDVYTAFNSIYLDNCTKMVDSSYSSECEGSHDLFGCVNLKNKSFCIFNRQLTETEYREKIEQYKKWQPEKVLAEVEKIKKGFPLTQTHERNNENTSYGNHIYFDKDCYLCFDAAYDEGCCYLYDSYYNKHCFDMTYSSQSSQLCYQAIDTSQSFNSNYVFESTSCVDSNYIFSSLDVKDCLGCVGLTHQQYCILNRQYSKEEYEKVSSQILAILNKEYVGWNDLTF